MTDKLKNLLFVPAIGCLVFLFVPASASAVDKTTWMKFDNSVPGLADSGAMNGRIPLGTSGKGDVRHSAYPCVIKDGYTYKMWYTGYESSSSNTGRIYHATCDQLPEGTIFVGY